MRERVNNGEQKYKSNYQVHVHLQASLTLPTLKGEKLQIKKPLQSSSTLLYVDVEFVSFLPLPLTKDCVVYFYLPTYLPIYSPIDYSIFNSLSSDERRRGTQNWIYITFCVRIVSYSLVLIVAVMLLSCRAGDVVMVTFSRTNFVSSNNFCFAGLILENFLFTLLFC